MELCNMVIGVLYIKIGVCLLALPSTARILCLDSL
jgi:hypothetical protein